MTEQNRPDYDATKLIDDKDEIVNLLQAELNRWKAQGFPHPNTIGWPMIDMICQLYAVTQLLVEKGIMEDFEEVDKELLRQKLKVLSFIYDDQIENVRRQRMGLPPDAQGPILLGPDGNPIAQNGNGPHV